jgi:hypothetical protein
MTAPYIFRKVWSPFSMALGKVDGMGKKVMGVANRTVGKISSTVVKTMKVGKAGKKRATRKRIATKKRTTRRHK